MLESPDVPDQKVGMIVTELACHGSLFDLIQNRGALSEDTTRHYAKQLLSAVQHIHSNEVAHKDIKLENLLLDQDFNLKVADFGLSSSISASDRSGFEKSAFGGTPSYMAPELHMRYPYSPQGADLFAMGVSLFVMATGRMPFVKATFDDPHYHKIATMDFTAFWKAHQKNGLVFSEEFKELTTLMLSLQPYMRPGLADIAAHPWLTNEQVVTQE